MTKETNDKNFEGDVLKSDLPVLVDFWAEWCGPCKNLAPVIDKISEKYAGKLNVFKVNIEDSPEVPTKYEIRGIPNLILFKNGEVVDSKVGALPQAALEAWVEENI
jgi:thioredoxin 1